MFPDEIAESAEVLPRDVDGIADVVGIESVKDDDIIPLLCNSIMSATSGCSTHLAEREREKNLCVLLL